jgi:hypothetical protein
MYNRNIWVLEDKNSPLKSKPSADVDPPTDFRSFSVEESNDPSVTPHATSTDTMTQTAPEQEKFHFEGKRNKNNLTVSTVTNFNEEPDAIETAPGATKTSPEVVIDQTNEERPLPLESKSPKSKSPENKSTMKGTLLKMSTTSIKDIFASKPCEESKASDESAPSHQEHAVSNPRHLRAQKSLVRKASDIVVAGATRVYERAMTKDFDDDTKPMEDFVDLLAEELEGPKISDVSSNEVKSVEEEKRLVDDVKRFMKQKVEAERLEKSRAVLRKRLKAGYNDGTVHSVNFRDIFVFGKPTLMPEFVNVVMLGTSLYLGYWVTTFMFIAFRTSSTLEGVLWLIATLLPVVLSVPILSIAIKTSTLLKALTELDVDNVVATIKRTETVNKNLSRLRKALLYRLRRHTGAGKEKSAVTELFYDIDDNQKGGINQDEFSRLLVRLQLFIEKSMVKSMFTSINLTLNGDISIEVIITTYTGYL